MDAFLLGLTQSGNRIESKPSISPVEPDVGEPSADTRIFKIFAPPKVSRIPVELDISDTPADAPAIPPLIDEPWLTNIPIDQWAQASLPPVEAIVAPPPETSKTEEHATKPSESEPRSFQLGISAKTLLVLFIVFAIALVLFTQIATRPLPAPPVQAKPNTTAAVNSVALPGTRNTANRPVLVRLVRPVYPLTAKKQHLNGDVSLEVNIATDGSVQHVSVLRGNPVFVPAARRAVQQWRYQPATQNGTPVASVERVVIPFRDNR
jgi:protein TonB